MHCIKTNTQFTTDFLDISIPHLTVSVQTLQSHIYVSILTFPCHVPSSQWLFYHYNFLLLQFQVIISLSMARNVIFV